MLFKSEVVTQASGSIGGTTYSHNRSGMYRRARAIPVNPNTTRQQQVRNAMNTLTTRFVNTLSIAQREAWDLYGENVPSINKLGDPILLSGLNQYVRSNLPRLQAGLALVDDGPTTFNRGDFTAPAIGAAVGAGISFTVTFEDSDDWASEDGAALLIYQGRPASPATTYFRGPYRFSQAVEGNSTTPPTSPTAAPRQFALATGNLLYARFQVTRADGRLSPFTQAVFTVT